MPELDQATLAVIEDAADKAAKKAVVQTLISLGVDHKNPLEVQRDFAALRDVREMLHDPEFRKDMVHLRTWRKTMDAATKKSIMVAVGMVVTAGLTALGLWIKMKFWPGV